MATEPRFSWRRFSWPRLSWRRGVREAALTLAIAAAFLFLLGAQDSTVLRGLETASLDLRFRLRGVKPPEPETVVVLVDDRSLAALGRWPLSRRLFIKAVQTLEQAGARVIPFYLLFAGAEQPVPADLRSAARTAAGGIADPQLRGALAHLADDNPDADFAAAIRASGRVLLPAAFAFEGPGEEAPLPLAQQVSGPLDRRENEPIFPLQPHSAVLPV